MKVLQINAVNQIASTGRICCELYDFLQEKGVPCVTAYSKGNTVHAKDEYIIGNPLDTKLHGFLSRLSGKQGYFSRLETDKLLRFTDEYVPDIVILHNLHANYINLPKLLRYLAEKDIATVAVLHDCWFFTGKCCHYTADACYKWRFGCGDCPSLKKYNVSWFFDRTPQMFRDKEQLFGQIPRLAVVGVSDWLTNEAKKAPIFAGAKEITRIYNWVDGETFCPVDASAERTRLGLDGKKVLLSVASAWSNSKGLQTVLEIAAQLSENERLVLVGNIPQPISLPSRVLHLPTTHSVNDLVRLYSMADAFLQPSLEETFGKVTAEALACGTPAVCFDSTANPEIIGEGCGAVVPIGDIDAVLAAVRQIFSNGKAAYAETCRNYAQQNFSAKRNQEQYLQLFYRLTGEDTGV